MENITLSDKEIQKKHMRLRALAIQWERDPRFKEFCRQTWDPKDFYEVEARINLLKEVDKIEACHTVKSPVEYLDISEIDVKAWEKKLYD